MKCIIYMYVCVCVYVYVYVCVYVCVYMCVYMCMCVYVCMCVCMCMCVCVYAYVCVYTLPLRPPPSAPYSANLQYHHSAELSPGVNTAASHYFAHVVCICQS